MFERTFPVVGLLPMEHMHVLLERYRRRDRHHEVTLANPPFERDELNRITAVRLRFKPLPLQ